jgi:hypothetical protein
MARRERIPLGTIDSLQVRLSRPDMLSHMDWPPVM